MSRNVGIALGIAAAIVVAVGIWFATGRGKDEQPPPPPPVETQAPTPTPTLAEQLHGRLAGVTLATAGPVLKELASGLSTRPELVAWLSHEDMIRRFVATVDNIAAGKDPKTHLDFFRPTGSFSVMKKGDEIFIDPASYHRYDTVAEVFESLDIEGVVSLFHEIEPLLEEANREISPPGETFRRNLSEAIDHLLATPVPEGDIKVRQKVVTYRFADPSLERLSPAQRHLLRMGPENTRRIQEKLRQIKAGLGL